jgi:hypothetical protein
MVLIFFYAKGVIYSGETVNTEYIRKALATFLKAFRKKRPITSSQDWFLHWDNAPIHTAPSVKQFLVVSIKMIRHPPYSPDRAPVDFFLFPRVKSDLAASLCQDTFRTSWEGVIQTIARTSSPRLLAVDEALQIVRPNRR